jgi:hypothetical protein
MTPTQHLDFQHVDPVREALNGDSIAEDARRRALKHDLGVILRRLLLVATSGGGFEKQTKRCFLSSTQGCQMAYFETKNPNLGHWIFWRSLEWKMLVYFMTIKNI